jgi:hypothetical protein
MSLVPDSKPKSNMFWSNLPLISRWQAICALMTLLCVYIVVDALIGRLELRANDDVFVFFNYAKNFVLGRYFAYDPRNIPSEGFTSWVYLFLLIPFEYFKVNLMYAVVLINIAAILGCAGAAARIYSHITSRFSYWALGSGVALLHFASTDSDLLLIAGWGQETLVNGFALLCLISSAISVANGTYSTTRWSWFYALGLLSVLVRPENGAIAMALFLWLLFVSRNRRSALRVALIPALLFTIWLSWKYWVFGDIFPTGYYRKMSTSHLEGLPYIFGFFKDHSKWAIATGLCLLFSLVPRLSLAIKLRRIYVAALVCGISTIVIFAFVNPIVGYGYRFLVLLLLLTKLVPIWAGSLVIESLSRQAGARIGRTESISAVAFVLGLFAFAIPDLLYPDRKFDESLYVRAENGMANHLYLAFGSRLKNYMDAPEKAVLVFGDAGGVPYALGSIFIDLNGLTEPAIARMVEISNEAEKRAAYNDYILSHDPDIVVAYYGGMRLDGVVVASASEHDPLNEPNIDYFVRLQQEGFRYACSLPLYYELHFALNPNSPNFRDVKPALMKVCDDMGGYRSSVGLKYLDTKSGRIGAWLRPL